MPKPNERIVAAVLFTDIVDSTSIATALGDARWRVLLTRHHAIARRALKDQEGELMDTAGDGIFAIFGTPAAAIRCACTIAEGVQELGIDIRAGIHFGETETIGGKLGGIAVHTGARVMSIAGPSEVLVTSTAREMAAGSGIAFEDRGAHPLKGIEQEQYLFAVTAVEGRPLPAPLDPEVANGRRATIVLETPHARRWLWVAVAAGVVVMAAAIVVRLERGGAPKAVSRSLEDVAVQIDPDGDVLTTVPNLKLDTHGAAVRPQIAIGEAGVWVIDAISVTHIDPSESMVEERIPVTGYQGSPTGHTVPDIAVGARLVWMTVAGATQTGTGSRAALLRIDPATNEQLARIRFGAGSPTGVAIDEDSVWESLSSGVVEKVDATTGTKLDTISVPGSADLLATGEGAVWVGDLVAQTITRIDAATDVVDHPIQLDGGVDVIAVGVGGVWVLDRHAGTVTRIDATTGEVSDPFRVGGDPGDLAVGLGSLWVSSESGGTVWKIDPITEEAARIVIGAPVAALAVDDASSSIWLVIPPVDT